MDDKKNAPCISWERVGFIACFLISAFFMVYFVIFMGSINVNPAAGGGLQSISTEQFVYSTSFLLFFFVFVVFGLAFLKDFLVSVFSNKAL